MLHVKGFDNATSSFALKIENSGSTQLLSVTNNGVVIITGSLTVSGGLPQSSGSGHVLTYNTSSGVFSYTASSALGGIPSLQQVIDFNHDLVNGNNFQGTGTGIGAGFTYVNAFGENAAAESSPVYAVSNINALGLNAAYNPLGFNSNINAFGPNAAETTQGSDINALGFLAGSLLSGDYVNVLGPSAGYDSNLTHVNAFGFKAAANNSSVIFGAYHINAMGESACDGITFNVSFGNINAFGSASYKGGKGGGVYGGSGTHHLTNINALGEHAAAYSRGSDINALGFFAAYQSSGSNIIAIGSGSLLNNTGSNVVGIGSNAGKGNRIAPSFIISNDVLPSYIDWTAASASINVTLGASTGSTYLYYDQTNKNIGAIRL
jgi:hypothetical protein